MPAGQVDLPMDKLVKVKGIILKTVDFGESDKIATLFSIEKGKLQVVLKGVKKKDAKLKYASQPLCFGDYDLVPSKDWFIVSGAEMTDTFFDLAADIDRFFSGCLMLEIADSCTLQNEPNADLFLSLLKALKELTYSTSSHFSVAVKFLLEALNSCGYRQTTNECAVCSNHGLWSYDAEIGGLVCLTCRRPESFAIDAFDANNLRFIADTEWTKLTTLKLDKVDKLLSIMLRSVKNLFGANYKSALNLGVKL